jgi:MASE6 protein
LSSFVFKLFNKFWKSIIFYIDESPVTAEEKNRFHHYTVFILLGIPTMVVFSIYHLINQNYTLASVIFASVFGLSVGWFLIRNLKNGIYVYRTNSILFLSLILYMLIIGGDDGSKILWIYTYPLIAFFLLGKKEGLYWNIAVFLIAVILFFLPENLIVNFQYSFSFKIRFIISYLIVSSIAFWFEYFRQQYREGMEVEQSNLEKEKQELKIQIEERKKAESEKEQVIKKLEDALDMVNKLSGFLPICSNCHKIRDDGGKWNQLEQYIRDHSEVEFSHGICPDCINKLYPDLNSD